MKTRYRNILSRLFALLAAFALTFAPGGAQAQPAYAFPQQELDRMLAPIALYPDALLSQILIAANYPHEVIDAANWANDWAAGHPGFSGDEAVSAAENENWDASVIALAAFPQVLAQMRENLQWTQALGSAYRDQPARVMDTVQALRRRAQAEGSLRSDERASLIENGPSLLIQPYDPQVVYVPYYDPMLAYGQWWWPASLPVYLRPAPVHYGRPAYAGVSYFGPPVRVSARAAHAGNHDRTRPPTVHQTPAIPALRPVNAAPVPIQIGPRRFDPPGGDRIRPAWNVPTRTVPGVRPEHPRTTPPSYSTQQPARVSARPETTAAVTRPQFVAQPHPPPVGSPRMESRPPPPAPRQDTHGPAFARPKTLR